MFLLKSAKVLHIFFGKNISTFAYIGSFHVSLASNIVSFEHLRPNCLVLDSCLSFDHVQNMQIFNVVLCQYSIFSDHLMMKQLLPRLLTFLRV